MRNYSYFDWSHSDEEIKNLQRTLTRYLNENLNEEELVKELEKENKMETREVELSEHDELLKSVNLKNITIRDLYSALISGPLVDNDMVSNIRLTRITSNELYHNSDAELWYEKEASIKISTNHPEYYIVLLYSNPDNLSNDTKYCFLYLLNSERIYNSHEYNDYKRIFQRLEHYLTVLGCLL